MTPAKRMSAALKAHLVPVITDRGFSGTFPRYVRVLPDAIQFIAIFYDKEGSRFFLEFGSRPRGALHTSWGEVVPEDKLLLEHVPFPDRARLHARPARGGSGPADWFSFDNFGAEQQQYAQLALSAAALLAQVEAWLASGSAEPNVSRYGL